MILPKLHFEFEKWKFNKEFGIYVSSLGNIKSKSKIIKANIIINENGYVGARIENLETENTQTVLLHRLVLLTFNPVDNYKELTVDHLDSNKRNNKVKNLEWVTREENQKRAREIYEPAIEKDIRNSSIKKNIQKTSKKEKVTVQGPFYIYDTYGNEYKNCIEAAIKTLKTNGFSTDEKTVQQTATKIGESIGQQDKYFGVFWYRRNRKGEMKPVNK